MGFGKKPFLNFLNQVPTFCLLPFEICLLICMSIVLIGLNHHTAPVEVREQLAFAEGELLPTLQAMTAREAIQEVLIISTCNRVEVIAEAADANELRDFLYELKSLPRNSLNKHLFQYTDAEAVQHAFRVAASLDSMIIGEPQMHGRWNKD